MQNKIFPQHAAQQFRRGTLSHGIFEFRVTKKNGTADCVQGPWSAQLYIFSLRDHHRGPASRAAAPNGPLPFGLKAMD